MNEPVYILKLGLQNVRCFGEHAELDLSDGNGNWRRWTVILGDNGLGKTTLLQVLAGLETRIFDEDAVPKTYISRIVSSYFDSDVSFLDEKKLFVRIDYKLIRNFKILEGFIQTLKSGGRGTTFDFEFEVYGYGANRTTNIDSLVEPEFDNSETLINDSAKLINAEGWLLQLDYAASKQSDIQTFAEQRRDQVKKVLLKLLCGVDDIRFTEPTKLSLKSNVEFHTSFGWKRINELSFGYKTVVLWVVDLIARMFNRYPDSDNPLAKPAIVLVDEIDIHLHPKWQREIFDYLTDLFPQTQFVVTAHSPLVVQSAPKDANIVVLRKEGDYVVIDNENESVQSWRLDQIMSSDLFGIESARGPETEKWLEERKELLKKQTLTREEQERLDMLNEKVDALPTADNDEDREAMDIIRKAADYLKNKIGVE